MREGFPRAAVLVAIAIVAAACGSKGSGDGGTSGGGGGGVPITGAGSTFAAPMYQAWAASFKTVEPGAKVNYQAIGSGGGVQQFTAKTVQFGATDVPLQDADIQAITDKNYIEFPTVLGAVVVAYNVQGIDTALKLDGPTVANIFLGKITTWNDPAIAAQNAGVQLPNTPITLDYRADESGTTAVFTGWLSDVSPDWKSQVGSGKAVQWPTGKGGNGNDGVAALVSQTNGSVGYLSYDFAVSAQLGIADIKAPDGTYVAPSVASITAAGGGLSFPITPDTNILNSSTSGAYPIASTTYVLIYTDQTDQAKAQTLVDFWTWSLTTGQAAAKTVNYAPLPSAVAQGSLAEVKKIVVNGTPITASAGST
jgi:phosphate transport system substrate-binding protein